MVKVELKRFKVIMTMDYDEAYRLGKTLKRVADETDNRDPSIRTVVNTLLDAGEQVIQI